MCNIFSTKNDQYYYLIAFYVSRAKYFLTKLATVFLLEICFVWILFTAHQAVGYLFFPKDLFLWSSFVGYFNLWLLMVFYGLIALALYQVLKNNYITIVVFSLYILSVIINEENNDVTSFFNSLFLYLNEEGIFYFHFSYAILLIVVLFSLNLIVYLIFDKC